MQHADIRRPLLPARYHEMAHEPHGKASDLLFMSLIFAFHESFHFISDDLNLTLSFSFLLSLD